MVTSKTPSKSKQAEFTYTKDEFGKEMLLKNGSLQVMMEWEKPYIIACIDELQPKGDVLEIGFGLGYSASKIQAAKPKSHTIVECDHTAIMKAKEATKNSTNIKIVEDTWQHALDSLGIFDAIFFDDYSPIDQAELDELQADTASCQELTDEINHLQETLASALKQFRGIRFSDQQLQEFGEDVLKKPNVSLDQITKFINSLESQGNITTKQKTAFLKNLENIPAGKIPKTANRGPISIDSLNRKELSSHLIQFTEQCLDKHMRGGSKLAAVVYSQESIKDNPEFKNRILSRKDVTLKEKPITVQVPSNCKYYKGKQARIVIIEKRV